jgi:DNA polymerase I-like protein with 3'-5' exonuclease and polymerase domains
MTKDVFEFQLPYLTENHISCIDCDLQGSAWLFHNVDLPLIPILAKMRVDGIDIDNVTVEKLREKYAKLRDDALDKFNSITKEVLDKLGDPKKYKLTLSEYIKETANVKKYYVDERYCASINQSYKNYCNIVDSISYPINYNSPIQIQVLFYDMLKVGTVLSKYPRKTDRHVLDTIIAEDKYKDTDVRKITEALVEVKKYDKLIGGFIDKLSEDAKLHNGRIFCDFNQVGTNTLRMSSSNPKNWAYAL